MHSFDNKVIWITGASSGIGEATAFRLAAAHARLILTAMDEQRLLQTADRCRSLGAPAAAVLPCDLADLDCLPSLADRAWHLFGHIDIFYNNAGISQRGTAMETQMQVIRKVMDVDFYAPVVLTKEVLPRMVARGGGHLVVTTSITGRFGFPLRCAYSSAKHALYGFFETVQAECRRDNIRVTIVCPGRVRTNISLRALEKDGRPHGQMDAGQADGITPQRAAAKIVRAIARERREVLVGGSELLMVFIKRFFPSLCARLVRRIKTM